MISTKMSFHRIDFTIFKLLLPKDTLYLIYTIYKLYLVIANIYELIVFCKSLF